MFGIGASEIALILIIALIFVGPSKLPEIARTVGKSYRELMRAIEDVKKDFSETGDTLQHDLQSAVDEEHKAAKARTAGETFNATTPSDIDKPQTKV
jgi:sec-independent protein translocase protein TatB